MNRLQRIVPAGFSILVASLLFWGWKSYAPAPTPEEGSREIPSMGTPKITKAQLSGEKQVLLNDPSINKNWGLMGTGGASDIGANEAWKITQGSRDIRIAIIDTGCDVKHPDLKNNVWVNAGESGFDNKGRDKTTNGVDDDNNGFIDDVHGWNFVQNNNDLTDNHGHGTHVSGIAGAEGGNGIGISGVAPRVSLICLKYFDPKIAGNDNLKNTIRAIRYAVKMKAHIINYSGGGLDFSREEFDAVQEARNNGVLFVAAAGNEYSNSDKSHYYPANYPLDNIISVTAINPSSEVLKSSNFGTRSVHIAAPGESIFSTLPSNRYGVMTGTSQATAFVSGVAALLMANNRDFDFHKVRNQILNSVDRKSEGLRGKTKSAGRLNSFRALAIQPPLPVTGVVTANTNAPTPKFASSQSSSGGASLGSSYGGDSRGTASTSDQIANLGALVNELKKSTATSN